MMRELFHGGQLVVLPWLVTATALVERTEMSRVRVKESSRKVKAQMKEAKAVSDCQKSRMPDTHDILRVGRVRHSISPVCPIETRVTKVAQHNRNGK
ncbi:hypothetical protein HD806DRAFT_476315 [Xylariaceae sp. AK1471]|nr:hypothetical protein HD806DRAFT_476315 [Xylariaceae sp. AK1471]